MENPLRLKKRDFKYDIYDFQQSFYPSTEEAIAKTIQNYPAEDPIELYGFNLNHEIQYNYRQSRGMMNTII